MTDTQHILIGNEDVLQNYIDRNCKSDSNTDDVDKEEEFFKMMRVRVGTILKTNNVSFLFGAGASMVAGGISLAKFPFELERLLLIRFHKEQKTSLGWMNLFYTIAFILTGIKYSIDSRKCLLKNSKNSNNNKLGDIQNICINVEHFLSLLHTWKAGMIDSNTTLIFENNITICERDLSQLIWEIKTSLVELLDLPKTGNYELLTSHKKFVKKILMRPTNLRRVKVFTLNYDTLIEQACDAEGVTVVDGFVGILRRVFRPESYDIDFYFPAQTTEGRVHRFDRVIHLYKLHGSLTWQRCEPIWGNPYGLYATFYRQKDEIDDVIIYPSPLKYGQSLNMPYSELFRRFSNAVAQPQSALFVIGYGFGDEHVNALIRQALAVPSFNLIIVSPDPKSDFVKKLIDQNDKRVWIIKGDKLGKFEYFVDKLLPDLREEEIEARVIKTYKELLHTKNE